MEVSTLESELKRVRGLPQRKRWMEIQQLARTIAPQDMLRALELAEKIPPRSEYSTFRYAALQRWAEHDPAAVLAYGETLKNRNDRSAAISTALTEWARKDPDAALAYIEKNAKGSERQQLYAAGS